LFAPTSLVIDNLTVTPERVKIGETITINVLTDNVGYFTADYEAILKINGSVEATRMVRLAPGESKPVSFSTVRDTAGTYSVEVGELGGTFTVIDEPAAPPSPPAPPVPSTPVPPHSNLPIIGGVIAALAGVAGLAYYLLRRRHQYTTATVTGPAIAEERPLVSPLPQPTGLPSSIGKAIAAVLAAIVSGARYVVSKLKSKEPH